MMDEKWIVGRPGGPSGPFWSIVSQSGKAIALQILDEKIARRIAQLPKKEKYLRELADYYQKLLEKDDD